MEDAELDALVKRLQRGDPNLTKLQLNHACLGPAATARILNEVQANSNIVELQLRQNYIGTEGMTALLSLIDRQRQLKAIDLRFNQLAAAEITRLWKKLQHNFTLEDIRIDEDLGDEGEVPFQFVAGSDALDMDGLTWTTFSKPDLIQFRTKLHELLAVNRRISECIRSKGVELKLRNRSLEKVPEMILLPHLKILDLRNNLLQALPLAGMDRMVSLEELYLDYNKIRSLPRSICNLGKLRILSARKNSLTDIPKCFSCLSSLKELRLAGNEIFEMPVVIATIPSLQRVEIDENPFLKRYPKFPTASDQILPFLKEELKSRGLPKNPRMRIVVLGADQVGKSSLIKYLQPTEASDKKKKKRNNTNVQSNTSAFFSSRVGDMTDRSSNGGSASSLGVGTDFKAGIATLSSRDFGLAPVSPSASPLGLPAHTSMTSSSDDGSLNSTPPVMVNGLPVSSGTTTPNISITQTLLPNSLLGSSQGTHTSEDLILNVWEFSGQTTCWAAHQFFVSEPQTIYLIVFNLLQPSEHQSHIEHYLHTIHTRAKDASVILVGTHADDKRCTKDAIEAIFRSILQRTNAETTYPNLKFLFDVDCTSSSTLKGLRKALFELGTTETISSPTSAPTTLAIKVPESWLAIEERLQASREQAGHCQAKKDDFFTKMIRRATGAKPPLSDSVAQLQSLQGASQAVLSTLKEAVSMDVSEKDHPALIAYLNAVGAVLTLKEVSHVILDPNWLLDAVSALLSGKTVTKGTKLGFIPVSDLEHLWTSPKFPASQHAWLQVLLEKFDVVLPADKKTLFVPSLLSPVPPAALGSIWVSDDEITEQRRYYVFNYCPTTTFFRLLQKLLVLAEWETQVHWRFGVVLQDTRRTAQVFISLDLESKTVKLIVRGRQQVLKMVAIAEAIETIMAEASTSKRHKYTAVVPCRHCIQEGRESDASLYPLATLEAAVNKNPANALVNCFSGKKPRTVRVDWLAPDVALSTFSGDRIEFKDIELGDTIGEGGYATVYKGKWKGQVVAVKQVKLVNIVNTEADNVFAEFRREVQLMSGLQNENLVVLKAICMEPFCMVIEFMDKGSLYDATHSPEWATIDWPGRIGLALDIARGMQFLHGMMPPIVHRDLKSPNILLTINQTDGRLRAKVADFGLSRSLDFSRELDGAHLEGNNPVWLAPEILLQQVYNEKVDVYSFGLILFEMISGQDYFGNVAFMSDIEKLVISGERPKIDLLAEDPFNVQSEYVDLVNACWDPSPTNRPTFEEITSILTSLLRKTGVECPIDEAPEDEAAAAAAAAAASAAAESSGSSTNSTSTATVTAAATNGTDSSTTETSGSNGTSRPKRDILKEYKSQQQIHSREIQGGSNEDDGDVETAASKESGRSTLRKQRSARTGSEKSSGEPPEKSPPNDRRRSERKKVHSSEGSSSSEPGERGSPTLGPVKSDRHQSERADRRRSKVIAEVTIEDHSNSSEEEDSFSASASSATHASSTKKVRAKSHSPSLGASVLAPNVRAQLSPRATTASPPTTAATTTTTEEAPAAKQKYAKNSRD